MSRHQPLPDGFLKRTDGLQNCLNAPGMCFVVSLYSFDDTDFLQVRALFVMSSRLFSLFDSRRHDKRVVLPVRIGAAAEKLEP